MPVSTSQIGWGSYDKYEGPFYWGKQKYSAPANPSFEEKLLAVTTSTEGGTLDAVNMYDRCVLTVGVIQYCEAALQLSKMLGSCAEAGCLDTLTQQLSVIDLGFAKTSSGWRFVLKNGVIVESVPAMQQAFLGGASGLKDQWTDPQKAFARKVAATFASLWDDEALRNAQAKYASSTILTFVTTKSKSILDINNGRDGWAGALKAAVTSYSANLPAVAESSLNRAASDPAWSSYSDQDKYYAACRSLAFGTGIKIWPERYSKIAPVISKLFSVNAPSLNELAAWKPGVVVSDDPLDTTAEIQKFLISKGYDLGPSGADGVFGPKTKNAIMDFQKKKNLTADGIVGPKTKAAMQAELPK